MIGCVAVIIGATVQASSYSVAQIIVGRLVTGELRARSFLAELNTFQALELGTSAVRCRLTWLKPGFARVAGVQPVQSTDFYS